MFRQSWPSAERFWLAGLDRSRLFRAALRCVSWGYCGVMWVRNWLYNRRLFRTHRIDIPVISVGNIAMGGTGKTPFVELLARSFERRIAIVSRGYGGLAERQKGGPLVVRPGMAASLCGDEPVCLARNLPEALVIVGRDRIAGAKLANKLGAEVVILDDGFQHRRLHRDCDIVLIDGREGRLLFPRGRLREPVGALKRASFVFRREQFCLMPTAVSGEGAISLRQLMDHPLGLFCGVSNPDRFKETIRALGGNIVHQKWVGDHQTLSRSQLELFAKECQENGAQSLLCTQKDWVKLPTNLRLVLPVCYLVVQLQPNDPDLWQSKLLKILS